MSSPVDVMLKNVRLSFPSLWEPTAFEDGGPLKFKASLLVPKDDTKQISALHAVAKVAAIDKWGPKWTHEAFRGSVVKRYLLDGDTKPQWGYAGHWYLTAQNTKRPLIIDRDKTPLAPADGRPYAGCYVDAHVEVWAQDNKYGKALNPSLRGIRFVKDGESFEGGRASTPDDFEDLEEDDAYDDPQDEYQEADPLA